MTMSPVQRMSMVSLTSPDGRDSVLPGQRVYSSPDRDRREPSQTHHGNVHTPASSPFTASWRAGFFSLRCQLITDNWQPVTHA